MKPCNKGEIKSKNFTRKYETKVKATCTKNMDTVGKTPKSKKVLPLLKKGMLSKYGYQLTDNKIKRHIAIKKATQHEGELKIYKRLVLLRTYRKNIPKAFKIINNDVIYAKKLYEKSKKPKKLKSVLKKTKSKEKKKVTFIL